MSQTEFNVGRLPEPAREPVKELAQVLVGLSGDNLRGLAVFGQVVTDNYSPTTTLVRSVAVLGGMDLLLLDQLRRRGLSLGRRHLQAPLMMTPVYIDESLDTFPLELLEIQQQHAMVLGDDIFETIEFEPRHMRLQAERELKREMINLRQGLLASAGKDKLLGGLCRDALDQTIRVIRGLFWLAKTPYPSGDLNALVAAEKLTGIDLTGAREVAGGSGRSDFVSFQRFYRDIERLSDHVNHMQA